MFQKIWSLSHKGLGALPLAIEVDILSGMPYMNILGLSEARGREIRERIRSALAAVGMNLPTRKITVNLAGEDPIYTPDGLDLPIALGILCAEGSLPSFRNANTLVLGGLSLSGEISGIRSLPDLISSLPKPLQAYGITHLMVPAENADEISYLTKLSILPVHTLAEAISYWRGMLDIPSAAPGTLTTASPSLAPLTAILGQMQAKRALSIACAGFHNLLLYGPPGSGKTLLAQAAPSLVPPPEEADIPRILRFQHQTGALSGSVLMRPVRMPHHSLTTHALIGGGRPLAPGELTLADSGLLILDEIAEFSGHVLENLRQPLESHAIHLSYLHENEVLPADFMLIGTMNLCPCGQYPNLERCVCKPSAIRRYQTRLGAPLLERIDLCHMMDPAADQAAPMGLSEAETLRIRVLTAAEMQRERYQNETFRWNSRIPADRLEEFAHMTPKASLVLEDAVSRCGLSLRVKDNIVKTARSIADLAASDSILEDHILEAFSYRPGSMLLI